MNEAQQAGNARPQTKGEFLVRASFNPSSNKRVDDLKRRFADLLDDIENWKAEHGDPRAGSEAQTLLETAAMFAVKMVTTPPGVAPAQPVTSTGGGGGGGGSGAGGRHG
jgi:hypothetical protein